MVFLTGKKTSFTQNYLTYKIIVICLCNQVKQLYTRQLQVMESIGVLLMWLEVRMT